MSESADRRPILGTIRARMWFIFALTLGVLVLVATVSVLVMGQVQSVVNEFIVQDFPRSQRVRDLNQLVEGVALSAEQLSLAQTKTGLERSFDQIDDLLVRLDITADRLSRRGVDRETLQITRELQLLRSEAQLGFQLKGVALDLLSELQELQAEGLKGSARLTELALAESSDPGVRAQPLSASQRRSVLRSAQAITTVLARASQEHDPQSDLEQQMGVAITALEAVRDGLPPSDAEYRAALDQVIGIDWSHYHAQRQRQAELTQTSERVLQDLQRTVESVVRRLDGYTQELSSGFDRRKARVLEIGRWAMLLILLVSLMGAAATTIVQRELVLKRFSRRLDIISQALGRLPTTREDTHVPVAGTDEIARMARRLEVLLDKALQIQIIGRTDELTQVNNRRSFFQLTAVQRKQASRSRRTDSLLMLDLDYFKSINDNHGHDVGDHVLRTVAQTCLGCLRENDILARMGGEEFSIYCPDTSLQAARKLADRICSTIRSLDLGALSRSLSLSIGLVEIPPDADSMTPWIKMADQALYVAKDQGRDRVIVADLQPVE